MNDSVEQLFNKVLNDGLDSIIKSTSISQLEKVKISLFSKNGRISCCMKHLREATEAERPNLGQQINDIKKSLQEAYKKRLECLTLQEDATAVCDVTQPGLLPDLGGLHPISRIIRIIKKIFFSLGFVYVEGPEIEWDHYNFELLNMPKYHPARDTQDSFYITQEMLLRTQTSAIQGRVMERQNPPVRIFSIGKCYRRDHDVTHTPMFHQFEGLIVDRGITLTDLKGILSFAMRALFGNSTTIRLRPHHFPFTEPSLEPDVSCSLCSGSGCKTCKYTGWLEMGGAGMVSPHVLRNVGYDPEEISGFAFGFGIERPLMIMNQIGDIRVFFENDIRLLKQF